jgi:hypothetical protein
MQIVYLYGRQLLSKGGMQLLVQAAAEEQLDVPTAVTAD